MLQYGLVGKGQKVIETTVVHRYDAVWTGVVLLSDLVDRSPFLFPEIATLKAFQLLFH